MRLTLVSDVDSRDGAANKDERLTNTLLEKDEGVDYAVIRPALETVSTASGNGNGMVDFFGVLISVFGSTLGHGTTPSTIGTVGSGVTDFAQSPL